MSEKILYKAGWLWQDYVGAKWQNLSWANTGDGHASYVYPQGKNSKSSYRPKSLFYHYQVGNINSSKYKIDKVDFVIVIGKFNSKSNPFPTVKVFSGGNNAPYKKSPIATITNPVFLKNHFSFDSYTLKFSVKGLTVAQLKNIIFEVDWGRSKISGSSTISVNRARIKVHYSLKTPKFSSYDSVSSNWCYTDETLTYKLTVKNTQERGSGSTTVRLPKGCTIVSHTGGGNWNNSNKTLSYTLDKGKSVTHTFKLKFSNVGMQYIETENNGLYVSNLNTIQQVSVVKRQTVPGIIIDDTPKQRDDIITYTFYQSFAKEPSYFDVNIQGFKENHPYGLACFTLQVPNNIVLDEPIRLSTELLDENINIDSIIRDESFEKHGISVQVDNDTVCLNLNNDNEDFVVNLRFPIYCTDDNDALIKINNKYEDTLTINPARKSIFNFVPTISRDKKYVQNSVNIGSAGIWTIRAKTSKRNFFDMKKELLSINIEKLIAYIGCIPLTRGHQVGDEASVKNTLIENRHNNRAYYGKKGDFSEDIGMTLRLHPSDVATLEGLCELDKPIPIDTVPHIPDGDPLNHRGWAELHGVSGIKKINSFLYECKPEVTYLTHNLITRFGIDEGDKIASNSIEYVLGLTHNFNESLKDYFNISYYQFFNDVEDENGDYVGKYELEPDTNLKFNSLNKLSNRGNYDLKFRNMLPALMSEDYDGNWGMAVRILDKLNGNVLFEHLYNNFKHYDFNDGMVLNECDVTSKLLNGDNYEIVNYDKLSLKYDGLASITELKKSGSYFNKIERDTYNMENNIVETFLYDNKDNAIVNGNVKVIITDNKGYYDKFNILSDINGKIEFPLNLNNGRYNIKFVFNETDNYKGCEYTYSILVEYETDELHFEYDKTPTVITNNTSYTVKLVDKNNNPKSGMIVYYSFKGLGDTNYSYENKLITNSTGKVNIPINYTNGSKYLKVLFKGFIDNGVIYPSCYFETMVNINIEGKDTVIESDDIELNHGDNNKIYNIILKDAETNVGLSNKNVTISFYNDKENYNFDLITNDFGVANVPIYLGVGNWFVDIHFKGDNEYKPNIVTRNIIINNFVKHDVIITSENLLLNENNILSGEQSYYKVTLRDENNNYIINEPVTFKVWNNGKTTKYIDTILYTDNFGSISLPYVSHGENVIVDVFYEGSNQYESSFISDVVSFEEVINKNATTFHNDVGNISVVQGGVEENLIWGAYNKTDIKIIVSTDDNNRLSDEGAIFAMNCNPSINYNVTVFLLGTNEYYSKCETLVFTPSEHSSIMPFVAWLVQQDLTPEPTPEQILNNEEYTEPKWDLTSLQSNTVGDLFRFRIDCNFLHGNTPIYLGVNVNKSNLDNYFETISDMYGERRVYTGGLTRLEENCDYIIKSKPIKYINNDNYIEYIEFNGVLTGTSEFFLYCPSTNHHEGYGRYVNSTVNETTRIKQSIIDEDGFGSNNETYQKVNIYSLAEDSPSIVTNTNDYYYMILFNNHTYEQLYFYSYLDDIVTSQNINFMISEGSWDLLLLGSGNDNYKGDYHILNNVIINTPSKPEEPNIIDSIHDTVEVDNNLFFNDYNYSNISGADISIDIDNKELNLESFVEVPYTKVEYLESSGTQYIDTEYILQKDDEVEIEMVMLDNSSQYVGVFGARKNSYTRNCYALFSKFMNYNRFNYSRTGVETTGRINSINTKYKINTKNDTCIIYNENDTVFDTITTTGTINDTINTCGLFCINTDSSTGFSPDSPSNLRIYSFKITNKNGEIVRDMIPVRDGTTGYMYDKITKKLYGNKGSGNFSYGNDIPTEIIPSISYINPNTLPDYDYVLKHNITLNNGIEIFDYNTIDVLDLNKGKYITIIEDINNGIIITEIDNTPKCIIKKDNEILFNGNLTQHLSYDIEYKIHNDLCDIYINDILIYENYKLDYNTLLLCAINDTLNVKKIHLYQNNEVVDEFTESVDTYEGKTFGSDIYFELKNNTLNFIDYGMLPEGSNGVGKIVLNDIKLPESEYELEVEIIYGNNSFQRLNNLNGYLKFRSFEDISVLNNLKYSNILCSPVPISNSITRFTRHTDEGTMYYVETPLVDNKKVRPTYLCNPYIQYKGGTELNSENGISLFNLDNGFSPVSVDNGLVKCEFHRRSGYISIYRYDDITDMWYKCNTLKLNDNPQLELWRYTDDMCEIHFGNTIWKMWRGRPFIQIKHVNDDFRILNTVDKVYCETVENETNMGFVEEHDIFMGTFEPKTSIQLFKEEWNIGENIKTDNFKLYHIENHNIEDGNYDMNLNNVVDNNKKAIQITSNDSNHTIGLNFPASPVYVKKPASSFSLLIDNFKCYEGNHSYYVKCRGFDENGCINSVNNIQYGIWEDIKKVDLNGDFNTGETIRVSFNNVPNEVKYIDFIIEMPFYDGNEVILNDIMLYEGEDIEIEHKNDNSEFNASQVEIKFNETYYANLYDEDAPCGLCIVRPYKEKFTLKQLSRANETVLIPYMKKCNEWDKPENVFIEYFNSKEQIINIDWEN